MSRAAINANVRHCVPEETKRWFAWRLKEQMRAVHGSIEAGCDAFGMTAPAVYDRLNDPDRFTIGELREMRNVLGMSWKEMVDWLAELV